MSEPSDRLRPKPTRPQAEAKLSPQPTDLTVRKRNTYSSKSLHGGVIYYAITVDSSSGNG